MTVIQRTLIKANYNVLALVKQISSLDKYEAINRYDGVTMDILVDDAWGGPEDAILDGLIAGHDLVKMNLKRTIMLEYGNRAGDGIEFFEGWRADLQIEVNEAVITEASFIKIKIETAEVMAHVRVGNWKAARDVLVSVSVTTDFTLAKKNSLQDGINDYIALNY